MIEVAGAGFAYDAGRWIFRNCSFRVNRGDVVAILGPNGQGKTTLLKSVLGLLPLSAGTVRVQGSLGYVPQSADPAFPYSVLDMVVMGRARHIGLFGAPGREDFERARDALDRLGLAGFENREFNSLSGGERQLILIARALASECDVLILDEPASALDFRNQEIILSTIADLTAGGGLAVLFTTHYPQHAVHVAGKVLLMHGPEDFQYGPVESVMTDGNLQRLYGMLVRNLTFSHDNRSVRTVVPVFSQPAPHTLSSGG